MRSLLDCATKAVKIPTLVALPFLLAACGASIQSSEPPTLNPAPAQLTRSCPRPVDLPDRPLSQLEVEELWIRDRQALINCGLSKDALARYYAERDADLIGG